MPDIWKVLVVLGALAVLVGLLDFWLEGKHWREE